MSELLGSARFAAHAAAQEAELAEIADGLRASESADRLRAARRLSALARAELSWMMLPVRAHFLAAGTREDLAEALRTDEVALQDALLIAIRNAYERYITHPMWQQDPVAATGGDADAAAWRAWMHPIAERLIAASAPTTRAEAAYLLALCEDPRAWDVYREVVAKRSGLLGHLELAILRCPDSRTPEVRDALLDLAARIAERHPRQAYTAESVRSALA